MTRQPGAPRSLVALLLSTLLVLLVAACGGGEPVVPRATATPATGGGGGGSETARPSSGAKARIVNLHVPATGEPGPVDVYLKPFALEGDKPAFSVPYGEVSDFFDPASDTDGNVFLSVYRPGVTGNGKTIMSWTETVTAGEVMTFVLTTGENLDSEGNRFGQLQTFDHELAEGAPAPTAGNALLLVNTIALENVIPDRDDFYLFISTGSAGCARAYSDTDDSRGLLGRQLEYLLPPSTTGITFHRYPADDSGFADCSNVSLFETAPVTLVAGQVALLLLYAPNVDEYKTMLLPLEP